MCCKGLNQKFLIGPRKDFMTNPNTTYVDQAEIKPAILGFEVRLYQLNYDVDLWNDIWCFCGTIDLLFRTVKNCQIVNTLTIIAEQHLCHNFIVSTSIMQPNIHQMQPKRHFMQQKRQLIQQQRWLMQQKDNSCHKKTKKAIN